MATVKQRLEGHMHTPLCPVPDPISPSHMPLAGQVTLLPCKSHILPALPSTNREDHCGDERQGVPGGVSEGGNPSTAAVKLGGPSGGQSSHRLG